MASERWWLEHIWELCRINGIADWLERSRYVFDLDEEDIEAIKRIDGERTLKP